MMYNNSDNAKTQQYQQELANSNKKNLNLITTVTINSK